MEHLQDHIISIFEYHTKDLETSTGILAFTSIVWDIIHKKLLLLEIPAIEVKKEPQISINDSSGFPLIAINSEYQSFLLQNFYELSFSGLYPELINKSIKSGLIEDNSSVRAFSYLWENRKKYKSLLSCQGWVVYKLWINWFYGNLPKVIKDPDPCSNVIAASKNVLNLVIDFADEWYYADTDQVYFYTSDLEKFKGIIDSIKIDYKIRNIKKGVFINKKHFILGNEGTEIRGFKIKK